MPHSDSIEGFRRAVGEDRAFQRRVWRTQRIGWVVMAAFVLLALAGGLGDGPLSAREAVSANGELRVSYGGIVRQDSATRWDIALPAGARSVTIRSAALTSADVTNIQPTPDRQTRGEAWLTLGFGATSLVTLTVEPQRPGLAQVEVVAGDAAVALRILVLP